MNGFTAFARKEMREVTRTWRIWVLPAIMLFFAVEGPVLARFTAEIVGATVGNQLGGLKIPTATYLDGYAQWLKSLSQIVVFAIIIIYAGIVSSEVSSGTAALVLTKPVSRSAFIAAKVTVQSAFLAVVALVSTLLTWGVTAAIFGHAAGGPLWAATLTWLVFGILVLACMTLLSSVIDSVAGAAGAGVGVYIALALAGIWKPLATYSPAALVSAPVSLASNQQAAVLWPLVTSLVLTAAALAGAVFTFRRKEL